MRPTDGHLLVLCLCMRRTTRLARAIRTLAIAAFLTIALAVRAQQNAPVPEGWASRLYHELETVKLDPARVYSVRDAAIEREDLHLRLTDGTMAFTRAVDGHITGALFEGHGEVLLIPPDRVERWSLSLFTGMAVLEEPITSAYLRFNDDTFKELEPSLRPAEDADAFIAHWSPVADALAGNWNLRLLETFVNGTRATANGSTDYARDPSDRMLFVRVWGVRSGMFDIAYDSKSAEQISVARLTQAHGTWYYDLWTSFPSRSRRNAANQRGNRTTNPTIATQTGAEAFPGDAVRVSQYELRVKVVLPRAIDVDAALDMQASQPGNRLLRFELSRYLKVREVTANGEPVEFVQNEALQGTELARRGNDIVSVVLAKVLQAGERLRLHIVYGGDVLAEAGGGLMYVGSHGDWYPNRGLAMSNFDLEFHYPPGWTLVATGKRVSNSRTTMPGPADDTREQVTRWISERPMPFAGFNLGRYEKASVKTGDIAVDAYASRGVESTLKQQQTILVVPATRPGIPAQEGLVLSTQPSPANNAERVAKEGARTLEFYARRMGPYPYSSLALTQMPGGDSQSWPGLIYLSSYVFLTPEERSNAHVPPIDNLMFQRLMEQHETAHQWWGDLLIWKSYREQWIVEALSNYCALLKLEGEDEGKFRQIMDQYRQDLLAKNAAGTEVTDAGPVTLGARLNSSRFTNAYNTISYGRGTWLFHMLRTMFLTPGPETGETAAAVKAGSPDEPFFRVLRNMRERFEGKEITTRDVQKAFEEELPPRLQYEGRKSLDWFFDGWANGTSVPKFAVAELKFSSKTGPTVATGKIVLKDATEGLVTSMPVYAAGSGSPTLLGRVFVEGAETPFRFNVPLGTKKILLDPYQTILSRP